MKICPTLQGATCMDQPDADTPIEDFYQESWAAYQKMKTAANGGRHFTAANAPDWSGVWTHSGGFNFDNIASNPKANGTGEELAQAIYDNCKTFPCANWITADLTPAYALQFRQKLVGVAHGYEWDQLSDCLPAGFPRFVLEPFLREFVVTPGTTWWTTEQQSEARRIYTDGRGHVPKEEGHLLWEGDSIGFWDGDTLVVHTIRMKPEELQRVMPSISEQASTVERIRMLNPNMIEDDITLYDPKALNKPWHGVQRFARVTDPNTRIDMWSCEENNNVVVTKNGGSTFILPGDVVTQKREYREPDNYQNASLNKAIAYGAKLMKQGKDKAAPAPKK